ncbi:MAG: hypothetical protein ABIJ09_04955 [Pseudomonadota bacterium]
MLEKLRQLLALIVVAGALLGPTAARAAYVVEPVPRIIPYVGHLEHNGQAVHGATAMTFTLYASLADCQQGNNASWTATRAAVVVNAGAFSVLLGDAGAGDPAIPDSLFRAAPIGLTIAVEGSSLSGCQAVMPVALAQRSSGDVPIGTVIDWWRPDATVDVPAGYKICDGTAISEPRSPFNGKSVPDLSNKFVRGVTSPAQIGTSGGQDGELAHQPSAHSHRWALFSSNENWWSWNDSGTFEQLMNWGDGLDSAGNGIYPLAHDGGTSSDRYYRTESHEHGHLPPAAADANVPAYVGLLKLMRIF